MTKPLFSVCKLVNLCTEGESANLHKLEELLTEGDTDNGCTADTAKKSVRYCQTCTVECEPDNVSCGMSLIVGLNSLTEGEESKLCKTEVCAVAQRTAVTLYVQELSLM